MRPSRLAWLLLVASALGAGTGCMETRRALGDDCLKDNDCLSGICSQLRCAAPPPTIDAAIVADATTPSSDAAAPEAASAEAASEASPEEASTEAAVGGEAAGE